MKSKKTLETLRGMTEDQLADELVRLKKEQFNLRFQGATGQLENTARRRVVRKDVARVKTIMKSMGSAAKAGAPKGKKKA